MLRYYKRVIHLSQLTADDRIEQKGFLYYFSIHTRPVIKLLCSEGADVMSVNNDGCAALHLLGQNKKVISAHSWLEAASVLIDRADLNIQVLH